MTNNISKNNVLKCGAGVRNNNNNNNNSKNNNNNNICFTIAVKN